MYKRYGVLLNNNWHCSHPKREIEVYSPASEEQIGAIPQATDDDIQQALHLAHDLQGHWSSVPAWERAKILRRCAEYLRAQSDRFAYIMSSETGKPLAEAQGEINASADQFEWYGEEAKRIYGQTIPGRHADDRLSVIYQPVGPCLALSAWNFPMLLPARKVAAALAAGNTVIVRPASEAPGSCFALGEALMEAGLPAGVLSILTGSAVPMVERLIASPVIRKVSLTGSVLVGKSVMQLASKGLKKVTMELGGHAPVIVHEDFYPVIAAHKLASAKFRNCGQVCISPSRFYVHSAIKEEFESEFARLAGDLIVGDGLDAKTQVGPLIRARSLENALALIKDAVDLGAKLLVGGTRPVGLHSGHYLSPAVLSGVCQQARIMQEEPFAPIAPIAGYDEIDEAVSRANATSFGLAAYVFTRNSARAQKIAEALEVGMVGINETLLATAEAPFGGVKASGFGREGGADGIREYLVPKYIRHHLVEK